MVLYEVSRRWAAASDAQVTALLREVRQAVRQADENLSAPVEDDDDVVVDLTV